MAIARQVQESLYPASLPSLRQAEFAGACLPARVVSGDLFDVIEIEENRVGVLCADVAGKGVSAALLVASVQAVVRTRLRSDSYPGTGKARAAPTPSELVASLNSELCDRVPSNRFITLFWAEYDAKKRLLRYTNAGHNPPLLFTGDGNEPSRLLEGGIPVGMFAGASYQEQEVQLAPGSLLAIYTDGITEALNPRQEEFGEQRLVKLCQTHASAPAREFVNRIVVELQDWASHGEQFDDMTLVVLKTG